MRPVVSSDMKEEVRIMNWVINEIGHWNSSSFAKVDVLHLANVMALDSSVYVVFHPAPCQLKKSIIICVSRNCSAKT